jgi:hypothetical protein
MKCADTESTEMSGRGWPGDGRAAVESLWIIGSVFSVALCVLCASVLKISPAWTAP